MAALQTQPVNFREKEESLLRALAPLPHVGSSTQVLQKLWVSIVLR